jgi:hypothetical protein|tara:strand:+ start:3053 stop:3505 length:453 start_codon:yes stop_codon:yes gene_type:complete
MAIYDGKSGIKIDESLNAIVKDADTNCTAVDSQGFSSVTHVVNVGANGITFSTTHKVEIELEHSDDNVTFTDVTSNTDVVGGTVGTNGLWQTIDADGDCNAVYAIGYVGGKRYSRVVLNFSGTHGTGTIFGVVGVKGRPLSGPTASQANQ